MRWHRVDGRTGTLVHGSNDVWRGLSGWTSREDPTSIRFSSCEAGRIEVDGQPGQKIALEVTDTRFSGDGEMLRGRLVLPSGSSPVPVVVLVHGSERYSGVDFYHAQHLFPAHGIGVFVYDKRGTGESSGKYTQDFNALANDAVARLAIDATGACRPEAAARGSSGSLSGVAADCSPDGAGLDSPVAIALKASGQEINWMVIRTGLDVHSGKGALRSALASIWRFTDVLLSPLRRGARNEIGWQYSFTSEGAVVWSSP